jgi:hypothetical protein
MGKGTTRPQRDLVSKMTPGDWADGGVPPAASDANGYNRRGMAVRVQCLRRLATHMLQWVAGRGDSCSICIAWRGQFYNPSPSIADC